MAARTISALLLVLVLSSSSTFVHAARRLPSVQNEAELAPESNQAAENAASAAKFNGDGAAKCVAEGLSELSGFLGASSRRVFSPRSVFMAPGADETVTFSPRDIKGALTRLNEAMPSPRFAVDSVTSYRLLNSVYRPANHALVVLGSIRSAALGAEPVSDNSGGKFLTFWDQIRPTDDGSNEGCSQWGLSWMMWQTRNGKDQSKLVPLTATIPADSFVSSVAGTSGPSDQPAATQAPKDVPDVLRIDNDFGHMDEVKSEQTKNEDATVNSPAQTGGPAKELKQSDVFHKVQTAWSAFVSALAADDVASASSILFGSEAVTLMAPGADGVTLATDQDKTSLLKEFKSAHLSLSVIVGEIAVLRSNSDSQPYAALVRSTYTIADAQGVEVEQGKRVELWRQDASDESKWHLSWSMWSDSGRVLTREEAIAAYENNKFFLYDNEEKVFSNV